MKYTVALLFLVGFIAFIGAAPIDQEDTQDLSVADPEKETAPEEDALPDVEQEEDDGKEVENDEPINEDEEEDEEKLAENEVSDTENDPTSPRIRIRLKCNGNSKGRCQRRRIQLLLKLLRLYHSKHCHRVKKTRTHRCRNSKLGKRRYCYRYTTACYHFAVKSPALYVKRICYYSRRCYHYKSKYSKGLICSRWSRPFNCRRHPH